MTEAAANQLAEYGYEPAYGARPLKRVINKELSQRIAREILEGRIHSGDALTIDAKDGEITFRSEAPTVQKSEQLETTAH